MAYDLYPAVDPSYNFPPEVRAALAASTELRNTVVPMTTTLRNNLTAGEKWDGRLILNTTTDRLERWDAGLAGWQQIADILDLAPYTAALLQRPGRNRIINGDFAVNQRAFTSATANGTFGLDRWQLETSGGTSTYSAQTPALGELPESARTFARMVTSGQVAIGDYSRLMHTIESVRTLSGKTVTVSFWAKAGSGTPKVAIDLTQDFGTTGSPSADVNTYAGQVTLSTAWVRYSLTVAVPTITGKTLGTSGTDSLRMRFWTSAGSNFNARTGSLGLQAATIDFWGVQVEEGSTATPFEVEEYGANLRRCQRYYCEIVRGTGAVLGAGMVYNSTLGAVVVALPVPMRTAPTALAGETTQGVSYYALSANGTSILGNPLTYVRASKTNVELTLSISGGTAGHGATFWTNNAACVVAFSAEL